MVRPRHSGCGPRKSDRERWLKWAIVAALTAAGIALTWWLIGAMAAVAAGVLFVPMLSLA